MNLKLLHYPPHTSEDPLQFGAGAHTDFGTMTVLLQEPGKHGLQVYYAPTDEWLPVPAREDVLIVNMVSCANTRSNCLSQSRKRDSMWMPFTEHIPTGRFG